jgi:GTP-binding protein EngB required for normal cell division
MTPATSIPWESFEKTPRKSAVPGGDEGLSIMPAKSRVRRVPAQHGEFMQRTLLHALGVLDDTCRRFALASLASKVREIIECSSEADSVDVVVLGRFKSGKSSLLNALFGRDVLPIDVLPVTAVVTRVEGGSKDGATVFNENGDANMIDLADLPLYVTERENPNNAKLVARVDVRLAGVSDLAGLRLVDTPGIGSIHRHNTEATARWLPRVGAALLAISVDQPLSEEDVALLDELRSITPLATVVLTKSDLVEPDQLRAIEKYIFRETKARFGCGTTVMPVSIRTGHEMRLEKLRFFLVDTIAGNRSLTAQSILVHKVRSLIDACRELLDVALRASRAGARARSTLRGQIAEERKNIDLVYKELSLISGHLRERTLNDTEKRFLAHRGELARVLQAELSRKAPYWRGNLAREAAAFRAWLGEALEKRLAQISREERDAWSDLIEEADVAVNRVVQAFKDRLAEEVKEALGIAFTGTAFEARPEAPRRPSLHLGQVFDTHIDSLWFVIPMALFRPIVRRQFRRTITWEVEKHLYRLASQWNEAISRSIEAVTAQARDYVRGEIDTLSQLLSRTTDDPGEIQAAIVSMASLESAVQRDNSAQTYSIVAGGLGVRS